MFNVPQSTLNQFKELYDDHLLYINTCNIYFHTIRLINGKHKILDRDTYTEYYQNIMNDIEMETIPLDAFIPNDDENTKSDSIFMVNRDIPEYVKLRKRVKLDDIFETFPATHPVHMTLKENPNRLDDVADDVFLYYAIFKYLKYIDQLRLEDIGRMTPVIEYIVNNFDINQMKSYLDRTKIDEEKCMKYWEDIFFLPDMNHTKSFYLDEEHSGFDPFDVVQLMKRFLTNIVFKSDIYIICGIYLILTFSKVDIMENNYEGSPCATYVRDVLSKL